MLLRKSNNKSLKNNNRILRTLKLRPFDAKKN